MRRAGAWSISLLVCAVVAAPASASDGGGSQVISARVAPLLMAFIDKAGVLRGNSTLPVSVTRERHGDTTIITLVPQP